MPLMPLEGVGGPEAWWQRKEMLVALLHDRCDECRRFRRALQDGIAVEPDRELGVALLSIETADEEPRSAPHAKRFVRALGAAVGLQAGTADVVIADRFGDVTRVLPIHPAPEDAARAALNSVDSIELQCPE